MPHNPAISLWGETRRSPYYRDVCTSVFIAALFTIARGWNQPSGPSTDEWIMEVWNLYKTESS